MRLAQREKEGTEGTPVGDYYWPERGPSCLARPREMRKLPSRLKGGGGEHWPPHPNGHSARNILVLFREVDAAGLRPPEVRMAGSRGRGSEGHGALRNELRAEGSRLAFDIQSILSGQEELH